MITVINLLPWREELRQEQKKQFGILTALMMFLAALIRLVASFGYFFLKETAPSKVDQYYSLEN